MPLLPKPLIFSRFRRFLISIKAVKKPAKFACFEDIDFGRILGGFGEGFGRPKSSIFAFFSMFFRSRFGSVFRMAKKSSPDAEKDTEGNIFEPGSGVRDVPGEGL